MPAFGLPGVSTTPPRARLTGVVAATVAALAVAGWQLAPSRPDPNDIAITLFTEKVGTGIESGSDVRFDGVRIGSVESIAAAGTGRQRIELRVDKTQIAGLTDALSIDYAPGNLFGISEIELRGGQGGTQLGNAAVVDLTGDGGRRTRDATMSALLGSLGQLTNDVVTPELISVLHKIAEDTRAFTPLIQSIVTTVQSIADTQRLPSSYLLRQYGATLAGLPPTTRGLLDLLNAPFSNEYLRQDGKIAKFDANVNMIKDPLIDAVTRTLVAGRTHYNGYIDILAPLLTALAGTVPDPNGSTAELRLLLQRLGAAMPDTPDGPVLNLAVDLRGVPVLAAPLTAALNAPVPAAALPALGGQP